MATDLPPREALLALLNTLSAEELLDVVESALAAHPDFDNIGRAGVDCYATEDPNLQTVSFADNEEY